MPPPKSDAGARGPESKKAMKRDSRSTDETAKEVNENNLED